MLDGAFPTPEDHDASYSTATSCSSISATLVSLLAWKRSLCLFPRVSPRVAARQNSGPYLRITTKASCMPRRLHQSRRRRQGFDIVRISYISGGALLIAVSTLLGWLPILGWGTVILGVSMIVGEFYPDARLMDRLEVRAPRCSRVG